MTLTDTQSRQMDLNNITRECFFPQREQRKEKTVWKELRQLLPEAAFFPQGENERIQNASYEKSYRVILMKTDLSPTKKKYAKKKKLKQILKVWILVSFFLKFHGYFFRLVIFSNMKFCQNLFFRPKNKRWLYL